MRLHRSLRLSVTVHQGLDAHCRMILGLKYFLLHYSFSVPGANEKKKAFLRKDLVKIGQFCCQQ